MFAMLTQIAHVFAHSHAAATAIVAMAGNA
jgi:hypothetical protein